MASATQNLQQEQFAYGEPLRWDPRRRVMRSKGVQLKAYKHPTPWRNLLVNGLIRLGVRNPLGEDLSGMEVTEEQVREALIREGMIAPDHKGKVLVRNG